MKSSLIHFSAKRLIIFLTATMPFLVKAQNLEEIQRAERFSVQLEQSAKDLKALRTELLDSTATLEGISTSLKVIATIELAYAGWTLGGAVASPGKYAVTQASDDLAALFAFILRPVFGASGLGAGQIWSDLVTPRIGNVEKHVFKSLYPKGIDQEFSEISMSFEKIDLNARGAQDGGLFDVNSINREDLNTYRSQLVALLKSLPESYKSKRRQLDQAATKITGEQDPANYNYLLRVMTLGGDQINFIQTVAVTMIARELLDIKFASLNQQTLAELKALSEL